MLDAEQTTFFARNGYVVARALVPAAVCERLIDHVWSLIPQPCQRDDPRTWRERVPDSCSTLRTFTRKGLLKFKDPAFDSHPLLRAHLLDNERLRRAAESLVGADLQRATIRGIHPLLPMPRWVSLDDLTGSRLHRSGMLRWFGRLRVPRLFAWPILGHLETHRVQLASLVYLDRVAAGGGGVQVWPGSHRGFHGAFAARCDYLPTTAYAALRRHYDRHEPVEITGEQGDVVFLHHRLLHANSLNETSRVRPAIVVDYSSRAWLAAAAEAPGVDPWEHWSTEVRTAACSAMARAPLPPLRRSRARAFMVDHPRLWSALVSIAGDPAGATAARLSRVERERVPGDAWLVVSHDGRHARSYKLMAYGTSPVGGTLHIAVNGTHRFQLRTGCLVERVRLAAGANTVAVSGDHAIPLHLRIVRTALPITASPILLSTTLEPSSRPRALQFEAPRPQPDDAAAAVRSPASPPVG